MKCTNDQNISIENKLIIEDSLKTKKGVNIKIDAAHAGTINGNYLFYTPKSLITGAESLKTFYKPLQKKHYSKTLGYIYDSQYTNTNTASKYFKLINEATTPEELVKVVNAYMKSKDFKNGTGFGVLTAKASLHDVKKINDLKNHDTGTVSIAGDSPDAYCNICSGMIAECGHSLGARYENKTCIGIIADNLELDHISFETIPANWETNSLIIQDSQIAGKLEIITEGQSMKLTLVELREKLLGNTEDLLKSMDLESFVEQYAQASAKALNSEFLLSTDKVLPFNSPLTIYVTQKLLEQLEDSEDKEVLVSTFGTSYTSLFEGKSEEEVLAFLNEQEQVQDVVIAAEAEETEQTTEVVVAIQAEEPETVASLEVTDADKLAFAIADNLAIAMDTKFSEFVEKLTEMFTKEANGKANKILEDRIEAFKLDLTAAEVFKTQVTEELKDSILNQILLLKNVSKDSKYFSSLKNRTIQELKMTLEDHLELTATGSEVTVTTVVEQEPVIEPTLNITDSQTNAQVDVTTAVSTMETEDLTTLEISDSDKLVSEIVTKLSTDKLTKDSFTKLYKEVFINHGSLVAKKLKSVLKEQNKL